MSFRKLLEALKCFLQL